MTKKTLSHGHTDFVCSDLTYGGISKNGLPVSVERSMVNAYHDALQRLSSASKWCVVSVFVMIMSAMPDIAKGQINQCTGLTCMDNSSDYKCIILSSLGTPTKIGTLTGFGSNQFLPMARVHH